MTDERLSSRISRWSHRASMAALLVLVAVVLVPDGSAWASIVATALIGTLLITTAVLARRAVPPMAGLIAAVAAQPWRPARVRQSRSSALKTTRRAV